MYWRYVVAVACFALLHSGQGQSSSEIEDEESQENSDEGKSVGVRAGRFTNSYTSDSCGPPKEEGVCYGEITCKRLRGIVSGFCRGWQGACCVFYRTCGGRTAQEISHFRNEEWPLDERIRETCSFSVTKADNTICGIRVHLEKLVLPGKVGSCSDTFLWITGVPWKKYELICGSFENKYYQFNMSSTSEIFLKIKSFSGYKSSWSLVVKQIKCSDFDREILPSRGDGGYSTILPVSVTNPPSITTSAAPTTTTTKTTTPSTTTTAAATTKTPAAPEKYIDYSACGVRGGIYSKDASNINNMKTINITRSSQKIDMYAPSREEYNDDLSAEDNVIQWDVPELKDSYFYKYRGIPLVVGQRITFGQMSFPGEFPWQVAIFNGKSFHCGGALIANQYVLTAAHCVSSFKTRASSLKIHLGQWDLSANEVGTLEIDVASLRPHKDFSRYSLRNDIAVIKLRRWVVYTPNIRPICLPSSDFSTKGGLATVTGWGRDENKKLKTKLHKLSAAVETPELCDSRWNFNGAHQGFIGESMLCMDAQDGDSCNGDSGGPTIIQDPPGRYVVAGIVSFGSGSCTDANLPGVYTRVSSFLGWIYNQMY